MKTARLRGREMSTLVGYPLESYKMLGRTPSRVPACAAKKSAPPPWIIIMSCLEAPAIAILTGVVTGGRRVPTSRPRASAAPTDEALLQDMPHDTMSACQVAAHTPLVHFTPFLLLTLRIALALSPEDSPAIPPYQQCVGVRCRAFALLRLAFLVLPAAAAMAAPLGCEAEVDGAREAHGLVCLVQHIICDSVNYPPPSVRH